GLQFDQAKPIRADPIGGEFKGEFFSQRPGLLPSSSHRELGKALTTSPQPTVGLQFKSGTDLIRRGNLRNRSSSSRVVRLLSLLLCQKVLRCCKEDQKGEAKNAASHTAK